MRIAAYLRVSTDRQAEEGLGLDVQRQAIRAWANEHGHRITAWHTDEGASGANGLESRVGLAAAIEELRTRRASGLVVYRLDRLARDLVVQEQLLAEMWRLDAVVHSTSTGESSYLTEDPEDPSRRMIRQVLGAVAEYERAMITLRLRAGRRRKAELGGYAYGAPPFGFEARAGELVPVEHEQATLRRILELRAAGASLREIAGTLTQEGRRPRRSDRWHPKTVASILHRQRAVETVA
jgi:DNA invertase Pin-like site-specific DNA recombinase